MVEARVWRHVAFLFIGLLMVFGGVVMFWTALDLYGDASEMVADWRDTECTVGQGTVVQREERIIDQNQFRAVFEVSYAFDDQPVVGAAITEYFLAEWRVNDPLLEFAHADLARYPNGTVTPCLAPANPCSFPNETLHEDACFALLGYTKGDVDGLDDKYDGLFIVGMIVFVVGLLVLVGAAIAFALERSKVQEEDDGMYMAQE